MGIVFIVELSWAKEVRFCLGRCLRSINTFIIGFSDRVPRSLETFLFRARDAKFSYAYHRIEAGSKFEDKHQKNKRES